MYGVAVMAFWVASFSAAPDGAAGSLAQSVPAASSEEACSAAPSGTALQASVRQALRRWARVSDDQAAHAARELLDLYGRLRHDTWLVPLTRRELQTKVRWRLAQLAEQIRRHYARQVRSANSLSAKPKGAVSISLPGNRPAWLGQAAPGAWPPQNRRMAAGGTGAGAGANLGMSDYGPALVDLIQRTIAPDTWDVRGGPGSIYYWRPGRALVVRQTTEVHQAIADTLEQLHGVDP